MGALMNRVLGREERALTATEALRRMLSSTVTRSGVAVNEQNAMQLMAVHTAVKILAESFAQVPLKVYRRSPNGSREEARDHPLYKILHDQPNSEMTSFALREVMMGHLALWGNSYCEISRNFNGEVVGLWPLLPYRTKPQRLKSGELVYVTQIQKDPSANTPEDVVLPARNVLHVPGFGWDGLKGLSVIGNVRETIGLGFAYEAFGSYFFGNNTIPGLTLTTDQPMKEEPVKELERRIRENHEGLSNSQRLMILTHGLKPMTVGMPLHDAQFIEQKKYTRSEIMGLYRIPPHMTNDTEKVSSWGTGIEQMSLGFIVYTMMPYFKRFEQVFNMRLFGAPAQGPIYPEFDPEGFLRGDYKTRMDGYALARQWGWLSVNDIKRRENEQTIGDQGDIYLSPQNMQSAKFALEKPEPKVAPTTLSPDATPAVRSVPAETRPIGPYADWDACIADQLEKGHSQDVAEKICGALEADTEESKAALRAARGHRHALADVTERILRREQTDVKHGIEKLLKRDQFADVPVWVDHFYLEHRQWAAKQATPIFAGIAESLRGGRRADPSLLVASVQLAAGAYVDRLCGQSTDDLKRAIRGEGGTLDHILASWDRRAESIAEREVDLAIAAIGGSVPGSPTRST